MFKNVRGKNQKSNLDTVDIPTSWPPPDQLDNPQTHLDDPKAWDKDDKPFRTLTLPEEITQYLKARNQRHFGQATGTPFTQAPLAELITEATALNFLEALKNDIAHCSQKPLLNLDNDASSCYDRIIVSLASLINHKYGQHCQVVLVNATTLKRAKYKLKTALGVTKASYSHCTAFPLHGTGQGSGNSPMIWCFISSTLFDCHQERAYGVLFESPDRKVTITFSMVGFVDDITGTVNDFANNDATVENLLCRLQHDAQLWNDLLWCSGGMLELSKCSYHFLYFEFDASGAPHPLGGTVGSPLSKSLPLKEPLFRLLPNVSLTPTRLSATINHRQEHRRPNSPNFDKNNPP
jgi:hypothetical protein